MRNEALVAPTANASTRDWIALTTAPLPVAAATEWVVTPSTGGVVTFVGVVRDHAEGRTDVRGMTYEAYEEVALDRLAAVAAEARRRWPVVERLTLLHRLGDLALSEASVVVVASAPHRGDAFEAARFCIDTLKETVPIWKQEHWAQGDDWALGSHDIRPVIERSLDGRTRVERSLDGRQRASESGA